MLELLLASGILPSFGDDDLVAGDRGDFAGFFGDNHGAGIARDACLPSRCRRAALRVTSSGTAWRCMFEPINARLASSCSRNGIKLAATETSCFGETSM